MIEKPSRKNQKNREKLKIVYKPAIRPNIFSIYLKSELKVKRKQNFQSDINRDLLLFRS